MTPKPQANTPDEIRQKIFNDISPHSFGFMGAKSFAPENVDYILALITEARIEQTNWFIDELWSDKVEPDKIYPKLKAEVDRLTQLRENK